MLMLDEHDSVLAIFFGKGSARKLAKGSQSQIKIKALLEVCG
jgi:hypothetical protein